MQIYLLSCLFLVLTGVRLSYERFNGLFKYDSIFTEKFITHAVLSKVIACGSIFFGILQILKTQDTILVGDIIPALFNLVGGTILLLKGLNKEYVGEKKSVLWLQSFLKTNVAIIGVLMIISGIIHAIFPTILLL